LPQAAEKLLKGYQVRAGIDVRRTHDLNSLGESLRPHFPTLQPLLTTIGYWTMWGVAYRYPGEDSPEPEPSVEELSQALDLIAQLEAELRSLAPDADTS
jgi:hypothetical protein